MTLDDVIFPGIVVVKNTTDHVPMEIEARKLSRYSGL